jgi:hypothetical protein
LILRRAAFCATLGFFCESFAGEELLLIGPEGEYAAAIDAFQFFVH